MPSELPRARLRDIVTNIDRVRAHLKELEPLRQACENELAALGDDAGAG